MYSSCLMLFFGGKKKTPKVFSALKTQVPQQAKKQVWCIPKSLFSREKEGTKNENTYAPKRLPGVCGGPLRAVLVYRFWPPNFFGLRFTRLCQNNVKTPRSTNFRGPVRDIASLNHAASVRQSMSRPSSLHRCVLPFWNGPKGIPEGHRKNTLKTP